MNENREKKLKSLLVIELSRAILEEIVLPNGTFVTVMDAILSPTHEHATMVVSVFPLDKSDSTLEILTRKIYQIQQVLNHRLNLRKVPKIRFELDTTEAKAARIEEILDNDNI